MDASVSATLETIRLHACDGLSPGEVLAAFGCSRRLAEMRFRKATGHSVLEEIHTRRLERACELLVGTNRTVEAIANMCGYGKAVFLQKLFKRQKGVTPSEWRRQNRR